MPSGASDIALNSFERFYAMCTDHGIIDPFMEFCTVWLRRNVPEHRSRISFVTGDFGQFLSEGPEVTAILDVEVGYLGDHPHDLRSEEHTSELQSLMRISSVVFCLKKNNTSYATSQLHAITRLKSHLLTV